MSKYPLQVRKALGKKAAMGPIPANMVAPAIIGFVLSMMVRAALKLDWPVAIMLCTLSFIFYFLLVGRKSWEFYSRFISVPTMIRIAPRYISPTTYERDQKKAKTRRTQGQNTRRRG